MSDNAPPFTYALNEQRTEVDIEINGAQIHVTTEQLETAIAHLGLLRSNMLPAVPSSMPPGRALPLAFLQAERYGDTENPIVGGAVFSAQSPYFGWLQIQMSPEWCAGLVSYFQGINPAPPSNATIN
jgi:hypothetical protein